MRNAVFFKLWICLRIGALLDLAIRNNSVTTNGLPDNSFINIIFKRLSSEFQMTIARFVGIMLI